ncbi:hypothetical protein AB6A40_004671 [Gnathostoma spinigerum]|uniref:SERTA domain-containing protein n=1 Tax=Gnathostoma spinigerum TaxID=75299 RepID=A0ABD6EN19_9BILA
MVLVCSPLASTCLSFTNCVESSTPDKAGVTIGFSSVAHLSPFYTDDQISPLRSSPVQFRLDEFGEESDSEDDEYSESASVSSDSAFSYDSSSLCSVTSEMEYLNERRREMLQLSISKIQTMNSSNVSASLRKSLLIFNTMKSLQRELNESGDDVYGSLIEGSAVSNDQDMADDLEEEFGRDGHVEQCDVQRDGIMHENDNGYCWLWTQGLPCQSPNNAFEDLAGFTNSFASKKRMGIGCTSSQCWTPQPPSSDSSTFLSKYVDDYLGMWGDWEDEDYNPLGNCNLTQSELLHMFGPALRRVSNGSVLLSPQA